MGTANMKVSCIIQGIGPDYVQADRQHPYTRKLEYVAEEEAPKKSHFFNLATGARWSKPARTTVKDADAVESLTAISCSLIPRRMLSLRMLTRWLLAARMPSDLGESEDPD